MQPLGAYKGVDEPAQIMRPRDANLGWNWTFWQMVLRPLLTEVMSDSVRPALLAPNAATPVTANAADIQLVTRRTGTTLHVIAVRPSPTTTGKVVFSGLP